MRAWHMPVPLPRVKPKNNGRYKRCCHAIRLIFALWRLQATMLAMKGAVEQIPQGKLDYILIDGNRLPKVRGEEVWFLFTRGGCMTRT